MYAFRVLFQSYYTDQLHMTRQISHQSMMTYQLTDPSNKKEKFQAVKQLKNNKSAGPDSIPIEVDIENSVDVLDLPVQEDLGRILSPIRMEGRLPHQAAKEG